jgi:Uma2 family endonuclease
VHSALVCGELKRDPDGKNIVLNPVVIVEVTSDSTESYDRGEKFEHYRRIPELLEYVLLSHRERLVEVFRRSDGGNWIRFEARQGARAELESIECELDVDSLYEGIELHTE